MTNKTRTGIELIKIALILGISANFLLKVDLPGLGLLLWAVLLSVGIGAILVRHAPDFWTANTKALVAALVFFGAMFAVYDSPGLLLLDIFSLIAICCVLILPALKIDSRAAGLWNYLTGAIWTGVSTFFGSFFVVFEDIDWGSVPKTGFARYMISVIRGLLIAAPIVVVISVLLMAADAAFESVVHSTFNFDPEKFINHTGFSMLFSWLVLGYFRAIIFGRIEGDSVPKTPAAKEVKAPAFSITEHTTLEPEEKAETKHNPDDRTGEASKNESWFRIPEFMRLGLVETCIILGLINLVFLAFVIIQVPYLFGGMDLVQNTPDFKLAEYARRGVGELLNVSLLILPVLLVTHWLLKKENPFNEKVFRVLAGIQIGLLFVIMMSAAQRLFLLTGSLGYGLTSYRVYAGFLLIWLTLVFVWFCMTVLRGMRQQFAYGAFWSALFVVAMLHFINPDDFVVRTNVELMLQGREFDASYNTSLSADAVPALRDSLKYTDAKQSEIIRRQLGDLSCLESNADFRSWNWSRWEAESGVPVDMNNPRDCAAR